MKTKKIMGTAKMHLTGVTFANRQGKLWALKKADTAYLTLKREPNNEHDPNAIKVLAHTITNNKIKVFEIGYVPAEKAKWLAPAMDDGKYIRITNFNMTGYKPLGVEFTLIHELYTVAVKETATVIAE